MQLMATDPSRRRGGTLVHVVACAMLAATAGCSTWQPGESIVGSLLGGALAGEESHAKPSANDTVPNAGAIGYRPNGSS